MKTIETKVYSFEELSDDAKETAMQDFRESNLDYDWSEYTIEDTKEVGKIIGIDVDKVYFSGFWSQGDGACFEGSYCYSKDSVSKILEYAPKDTELHRITLELSKIQRKNFYQLQAYVKHSGFYYHEKYTDIQVVSQNEAMGGANDEAYYEIKELLCSFMQWIYKRLEETYDCLQADEQIAETIVCNEYDFLETGKMF